MSLPILDGVSSLRSSDSLYLESLSVHFYERRASSRGSRLRRSTDLYIVKRILYSLTISESFLLSFLKVRSSVSLSSVVVELDERRETAVSSRSVSGKSLSSINGCSAIRDSSF